MMQNSEKKMYKNPKENTDFLYLEAIFCWCLEFVNLNIDLLIGINSPNVFLAPKRNCVENDHIFQQLIFEIHRIECVLFFKL